MPREQINHPGDTIPEGERFRDRVVHVVWVGSDVYIELEADPGDFRSVDPTSLTTGLFSPPLSRAEINKMIHALRRARDKAFGADA